MIAVPISPMQRMAVVAVPSYFVHHTIPAVPAELAQHNCIGLRLPTHGGLLPWDFEKDGREVKVRVDGQWTFNGSSAILRAALAGGGLAFLPETMVLEHIAAGRLRRVLDDWCDPFDGYYAYYPSRRQSSSALKVVIDALRHDPCVDAGTRGAMGATLETSTYLRRVLRWCAGMTLQPRRRSAAPHLIYPHCSITPRQPRLRVVWM